MCGRINTDLISVIVSKEPASESAESCIGGRRMDDDKDMGGQPNGHQGMTDDTEDQS